MAMKEIIDKDPNWKEKVKAMDEFAQFIEWNFAKELDWFLLDYDSHRTMQTYMKKLNAFYQKHRAFYDIEDSWEGFDWITVDDKDNSVIAFMRISTPWRGKVQKIVSVTNFTPVVHYDYKIAMPATGFEIGTPASISERQPPHTEAIEEEPFDSMISDTTRTVYGNLSFFGTTASKALWARCPCPISLLPVVRRPHSPTEYGGKL